MARVFAGLATLTLVGVTTLAQEGDNDAEMAEAFFAQFQEQDYTGWPYEPGVPEGFYVGTEPHGMILRSFINDVAKADIEAEAAAFSDGAVIIKENHMPGDTDAAGMEPKSAVEGFDGNLAVLTYMVKVEGYNPDAGDWFWARQQPDGTVDAAGKPEGCIGCHQQVASNDWVFDVEMAGN